MVNLELRGIPSVLVATTEFVEAARIQSGALGMDTACVFVAHPVQDRTDDEIGVLADEAVDECLRSLISPSMCTSER
jgi:hypothetical protein